MKNRKLRFIRAVYLREPRKLVFQFCGSADFGPEKHPVRPDFHASPRGRTRPASESGLRKFTRLG